MILNLFNIDKQKLKYFILLLSEKLILICFHLYFVNQISRDLYGIFTQTNYIASFVSNLLLFGIAIPFLINSTKTKNEYNTTLFQFFKSLSILISFFIFPFFILFSFYFSSIIYGESGYSNYLIILLLTIIADIVSEYYNLHNRINSNLIIHSNFILSRTVVRLVVLISVYLLLNDFLIAYGISSLIYLLFIIIFSNKIGFFSIKIFKEFKHLKKSIYELFSDGYKFLALYLLGTLSGLLINLILVNQFNIETLAIYTFNLTLASIPITLSQYITFYSLPDFSEKYNSNKSLGKKSLIKDIFFAISVFTIIFILFYFFYDYIFLNFINPDYSSKTLFMLIFLANTLYMLNNFIQFPLLSDNKYSSILIIIFISVFVNITYLYLSVNSMTILTPVVGLLIANSLIFILLCSYNFFRNYVK